MTSPLAEIGNLTAGIGAAALPGSGDVLDGLITYLSSAWPMWTLFAIGIALGCLWGRKTKRRRTATPDEEGEAAGGSQDAELGLDSGERDQRQQIARLEGELGAARQLGERQREELDSMHRQLEAAGLRNETEQARLEELSAKLDRAVSAQAPAGAGRSPAHARAPVIHLHELVQRERWHLENVLARLQELEDRLTREDREVWSQVKEVAVILNQIRDPAGEDDPPEEIVTRIAAADEHLRVFHQNLEGCLQRIETSKARIRSDEKTLTRAATPVAAAEAILAKLAASEDRSGDPSVEEAFEKARKLLAESRPLLESLENGIAQEIAELKGRIDWVTKDSPKTFLNAFEALGELDPPADPKTNRLFNRALRLLTEVRARLLGIELPLDGSAFGEAERGLGKQRIAEAIDRAEEMMDAPPPAIVAAPQNGTDAEGAIAHLKRQLALRESETKRLDQKLKASVQEIRILRQNDESPEDATDPVELSAGPFSEHDGGGFVRRLLGLGPAAPGPSDPGAPLTGAADTRAETVTLAEAQAILGELKLVSAGGSGNGGRNGKSGDDSAPDTRSPTEWVHLRERLARQRERITELEAAVARLRRAPTPSETFGDDPSAGDSQPETTQAVALIPREGLIIFRGNNPAVWGENTYTGMNCRSRAFDDLPDDIGWLRIRRLPGGESVILPISREDLTGNGDGRPRGFNGANEVFYGAHHLGAFDELLPQEVETRFTYGGWGFGHDPSGPEEQACGWDGRRIDTDTIFEFSIYREMPVVDPFLDRILEE